MKITIVGAGYVGLAQTMLHAQNHEVIIYDINHTKIKQLQQRISPIKDAEIDLTRLYPPKQCQLVCRRLS